MTDSLKISHSGRGKFDHCPQMYKLHYIDKIRPVGTTSALLFGSAIDKAAEHYLLTGNKEESEQLFNVTWNEQEINGILTNLKTTTEIEFHANDFDHELLTESDHNDIIKDTIYATTSDLVEAGENEERIVLAKWTSMLRKGEIILAAFINWVDKNVEEVLEVQSMIELVDDSGNEITGKADFVLKLKWYDLPLLVDLKTAARYYERGCVKTSEQLALYYFYLKNTKYPEMKRAAYFVLSKQIKKNRTKTCLTCGNVTLGKEQKCSVEIQVPGAKGKMKKGRCNGEFSVEVFPEASIQFIYDEIPVEFIDETIEKYSIVINKIQAKEFEKNLEGCDRYFGRECSYKKYCETGCMTGLNKKVI